MEYERTKHLLTRREWFHKKLIVTTGSKGCLYDNQNFGVRKVEIKDLTGAGDTFLTALVYQYLKSDSNIIEAIIFANECATQVVQQKGVNTINVF